MTDRTELTEAMRAYRLEHGTQALGSLLAQFKGDRGDIPDDKVDAAIDALKGNTRHEPPKSFDELNERAFKKWNSAKPRARS